MQEVRYTKRGFLRLMGYGAAFALGIPSLSFPNTNSQNPPNPKIKSQPVINSPDSLNALCSAFDTNQGKKLTAWESESNIANNLISIVYIRDLTPEYDKNKKLKNINVNTAQPATGLGITKDGFIVTASHNIEDYLNRAEQNNDLSLLTEDNKLEWLQKRKNQLVVLTQSQDFYPIDNSFWYVDKSPHIAVIKAAIPHTPEPIPYRISEKDVEPGSEIRLMALRNYRQYNQFGKVLRTDVDIEVKSKETGELVQVIKKAFITDAYGVKGYSGGVFTNMKAEFAGISWFMTDKKKGLGYIGGSKASDVIRTVRNAAKELKKRIKH